MSMFDWVRCTIIMPDGTRLDGTDSDQLYQTKDFDCELATVVITDRLTLELHPDDTYDIERRIAEVASFSGRLDFYGANGDFYAHVTCGIVKRIHKLGDEPPPRGRTKRHKRKPRTKYTSKAYRKFLASLSPLLHGVLGELLADELYQVANREGFVRRFLCQSPKDEARRAHDAIQATALAKSRALGRSRRQELYHSLWRPYRRGLVYNLYIPDSSDSNI